MKKIFFILIVSFFFVNCEKKSREKKLNEYFKKCYESNIQKLLKNDIWLPKDKSSAGEKIHILYEEFLLKKRVLKSIEKDSYITLLKKTEKGVSNNFSKEMEFNTEEFFPNWTILKCQDELYRNGILNKNDWQFKFAKEISKYQTDGNTENLKNAINIIPKNEFIKMHYRNEIINLIYNLNMKWN